MRQSAAQSGSLGSSQASSALQRLEEAQRQLEEARSERAQRDAEAAMEQVAELQRQQREMVGDVRSLPTERGLQRTQEIEQLREQKDQMHEAVQNLERELDRAASSGRADNPEAARNLQEASNLIRESKLKEALQYSRGTIEQLDPQSAVTMELNIEGYLQDLQDQLEQAREVASDVEPDPQEEALDQARDLVRGLEAMERRLNEPGQQGQQGRQGQQDRSSGSAGNKKLQPSKK